MPLVFVNQFDSYLSFYILFFFTGDWLTTYWFMVIEQ